MSLKLYIQKVQEAAAHNQTVHGNPDTKLLVTHIQRQMRDLVAEVVERQVSLGALNHLSTAELQLLAQRLPELEVDDFKLVEAIVEALVPQPTGDSINLENRGINIPE